ncbi:hypothetical protein ABPG77_005970 [Micractinium sp. CCAP 211/92]
MPCTCNQCVAGILSPRMLLRLERTAASSAEMVQDSMPAFQGDLPVHDPEVYLLDYVPPELRVEVARPFAVGFANAMATAAYLARQRQLPKPRMVAQMMGIVPGLDKSATKAFTDKGGVPEYALDAVLARMEEEHEAAGDGSFIQDEANAKALEALPQCRNDDQFQLLRQQLFANSDFWPCGPYSFDDEDWGQEGGEGEDDGWVHYDTSNWKPPAAAAAGGAAAPPAAGGGGP